MSESAEKKKDPPELAPRRRLAAARPTTHARDFMRIAVAAAVTRATTIQQPAPSVALRLASRFSPTVHAHTKLRATTSQPFGAHPQHAKMKAAAVRLSTRYTASSPINPNQPRRCFATAAKVRHSASHFSSTPPGRPGLVSLAALRGLFSAARGRPQRGRPQGRGGLPGPPRCGPAALEAARLEGYAAAFAFARRAQGANRLPAFFVAAPAES